MLTVDTFLESLRIEGIQEFQNLRTYTLVSDLAIDINFKTFDEVRDFVEITEVMDGEVPFLNFKNLTAHNVFCLSGTIVTGNLQDRTIKTSFILHPREEKKISVFCVEESRFHSKGHRGNKSSFHLSSHIRGKLKNSNQRHVWQEIREKKERMNTMSNNSSVEDIYVQRRQQLKAFEQAFHSRPEHIGVIAEIEGNITGMEVFGAQGIFHKVQTSLLSSYAIDALDNDYCSKLKKRDKMTVDEFIHSLMKTIKQYRSQSLSEAIIDFESDTVTGTALMDSESNILLQMEAYNL